MMKNSGFKLTIYRFYRYFTLLQMKETSWVPMEVGWFLSRHFLPERHQEAETMASAKSAHSAPKPRSFAGAWCIRKTAAGFSPVLPLRSWYSKGCFVWWGETGYIRCIMHNVQKPFYCILNIDIDIKKIYINLGWSLTQDDELLGV